MTFTNARSVSQIMEYNEAEYARQEMLERTVGVDEKSQKVIVKTIMHSARNRIGMSIVIEGRTELLHIEESGDSAGLIDINEPMLKTIIESNYANKGAILIRKNKIVTFNGLMDEDNSRQDEIRKLVNIGLGRKHIGAYSEVRNNPGTVTIVVSGQTGKISIFGHLAGKMTADVGLALKEFDIRGGVSQTELEYRLNDLLVGQGIDASLESAEIAGDIARKNETKAERKERVRREKVLERERKEEEKAKRKAEKEALQKEKERARSKTERGRFYSNEPEEEKKPKPRKQQSSQQQPNQEEEPRRRRRRRGS